MINLIFASDLNGVIGRDGKLPWNIPNDLNRFKNLTLGCTVVMGRKTYESLPFYPKAFPNRNNVILSNTLTNVPNGVIINSLESYLREVKVNETVWIVGGVEVYKQALPYIDDIYHTEVQTEVNGDSVFNLSDQDISDFFLLYSFKVEDDKLADFPYKIKRYCRK